MLTMAISVAGVILAFFSGDPALDVISGRTGTSGRALTQHHVRSIYATGLAGGRINHPELQEPADRESGPAHEH